MSIYYDPNDANLSGTVLKALDVLACLGKFARPMSTAGDRQILRDVPPDHLSSAHHVDVAWFRAHGWQFTAIRLARR